MTSEDCAYARVDLLPKVQEIMVANNVRELGFRYDEKGSATITHMKPEFGPEAHETVTHALKRDIGEEVRSYYQELRGQAFTCKATVRENAITSIEWGGALAEE